jgi:hypothetical protein
MFDHRLERFKAQLQQYWAGRAVYQVAYANEVARVAGGKGADLWKERYSAWSMHRNETAH